eukprot:51623-Prorocentrum_lima.AAC.1
MEGTETVVITWVLSKLLVTILKEEAVNKLRTEAAKVMTEASKKNIDIGCSLRTRAELLKSGRLP